MKINPHPRLAKTGEWLLHGDPDGHYVDYAGYAGAEAQIISKGRAFHLSEAEYADMIPGYRMIGIKMLDQGDDRSYVADDYLAVYYLRIDHSDAPYARKAGAIQ